MIDKNIKVLLFVTLLLLSLGIVSAAETTDNTTMTNTNTIEKNLATDTNQITTNNIQDVKTEKTQLNDNKTVNEKITTTTQTDNNEANDNKDLKKNLEKDTVKTATSTGQTYTYIELNVIKTTTQGSTVNISGHYYYGNDIPLTYTNMRLNINGQTDTSKTDKNGYFTYSYKTAKAGTNTVTVSYPGNDRFQKATATQTFNVKGTEPQDTYIKLNNINDVAYGAYTTINGNYYYGNDIPLTYTNMRININGQTYTAKTDKNGYFTYNYKTDQVGKNTVTVYYPGNTNFKQANNTKTFNIKITSPISTYITLNNIKEVNNGQYTTISGYYYYGNNKPLTQTNMRLNINGQTITSKTDNKGYFTYNYKTTKDGKNTVTVTYPGNKNFKAASTTKTFNVKSNGPQETYILLNDIHDVSYDDFTVIDGYYYYGNNIPLTYTPMTISVNGNIIGSVKTDAKGFFSYDYWPVEVFKNTATVSYHGNKNFKAATATKTFNVKITRPLWTYIDINEIDEVDVGKYITISGYYSYGNGVPLKQTTMRININGQQYTAKTDNNGYFTYTYKTTRSGTNTVTVSYPGNTNFQTASRTKIFKVSSKETRIILDEIPLVQYSDYIQIGGYYKDLNNNPIDNCLISIKINNKETKVYTNKDGSFSTKYQAKNIGQNNITVTSIENSEYYTTTTRTTFNVISKTTKIDVGALDIQYSDYVSIWGNYYIENFTPITYTTITLDINGEKYYTKTDEDGNFEYNYKPNKVGLYTVTATYSGNERYNGASAITQFYVTPKDTRIELYEIYYNNEYINDKTYVVADISGKFTDSSGNPLTYTTLNLNYGNQNYKVKTDSMGEFSYYYERLIDEYELITISYPGNEKYTGTSVSNRCGSFDTLIELDDIYERRVNDTVTIKGYVKDILRGYTLYGLPVTITLNGKSYSTYTSTETGYFEYSVKADKIGINNLTVAYAGSYKYTKSMNKTTFIVLPKTVQITVIKTVKSSDGEYIKIQGRIYDIWDTEVNVLKNVPLKLKIDKNEYEVMTDNTGLYSYNYKNSSSGTHNLTVTFEGNNVYSSSQIQIRFIPQEKDNEIEITLLELQTSESLSSILDKTNSVKKIGSDTFFGGYWENNPDYGNKIFLYHEGKNDMDLRPANKITSITFYYKNNEGDIIEASGKKDYWGPEFYTEPIEGYTPFKAIVNFRARTPQEIIYDDEYDSHKY